MKVRDIRRQDPIEVLGQLVCRNRALADDGA